MKAIRLILAMLGVASLAACYTSDKPLVTDEMSATPYKKITFYNEDKKPLAYTADGKRYTTVNDSGETSYLNLMPVEGSDYVAQISSGDAASTDAPQILYGYMRIDATAGMARLWKMVGTKADVRPGLRECNDVICIDDLNAYIAYAKEGIAAGAAPDAEMKVDLEQ